VQTDSFNTGSVLLWKGRQESAAHQAELAALSRRGESAWIQLPSALLETRYRLNAIELSFGNSETPTAIQASLRQLSQAHETEWNRHYLIAQPHAEAPCYHISDYVGKCVAGDLEIAERLRGRTVITLHQTEKSVADLLSNNGVSAFVEHVLTGYLETYGKRNLVGFSCKLPKFLSVASVLEAGTSSLPWSPALLETMEETVADYLALVFYETYNSAAVRNTFWRGLTTQFATCFLGGLRDFCHQERLRFALSLPTSTKTLDFELGSMLAQVDCPILNATEIDTPKRFVVAKWVCSSPQHAGISRKDTHKTDKHTLAEDASFGFNLWINRNRSGSGKPDATAARLSQLLARGYPKQPLLIVAPTQSLWTKPDKKLWNQVTKAWGWLCQTVWELGYDFRIVSEQELASAEIITSPRRGSRLHGNRCLRLNNSRVGTKEVYSVVLLPSCISLQEGTVKCLKAFTKAKGRLIVDEPTPYLLNGKIGLEPYPLEQLIYGRRATILRGPLNEKAEKLERCLRKWVSPLVSVYVKPDNEPTDVVQVHQRDAGTFELYYLFNSGDAAIDTLIEMDRAAVSVVEWDLFEGTKKNINSWDADGRTYLNSAFVPKQGRLFEVS
jgi:hypothetical protein